MKSEEVITTYRKMLDLALSSESPVETEQWETYPYLRGALEMLRDMEELPNDLRENFAATTAYIAGVMDCLQWIQDQATRLDEELERLEDALLFQVKGDGPHG